MASVSWYHNYDDEEDRQYKDIIRAGIEHIGFTSRIKETALSLGKLISGQDHPENWRWWLQDHILDTSSFVPYDSPAQDNLVLLLFAIRRLQQDNDQPNSAIWSELFTDTVQIWDDFRGGHELGLNLQDKDQALAVRQQLRWRNFNAFNARLVRDDFADVAGYGLWSFRDALEESNYGCNHDSIKDMAPQNLAVNIALDWLFIGGKRLLKLDRPASRGGGPLWKGPEGYNSARWDFWAQRFEAASQDEALDLQTRARAATGANVIMARHENRTKRTIVS